MLEVDSWVPTKFVNAGGRWVANRNPAVVARGSRLIVDILGDVYSSVIREHARGELLDLGCGAVPLYGMYRSRVTSVTCVDWPSSLHSVRHADVLTDLNEVCPLPNASFDTILCTDVLEHLRSPRKLFLDAARMLRPGGKLLLGTPYLYPQHELPHDYYRCSASVLRLLVAEAGLEVVELKAYGDYRHVLAVLILKGLQRSPILCSVVERLAKTAIHLSSGKVSESTRYPLGYVLVARRREREG